MKKAPERLRFAALAVDTVVFGLRDGVLHVLVGPVNNQSSYQGMPAFIGGLIDPKETAEEASARILATKAGLKKLYLEQLFTFSAVNRDKRNRVISVSYLGLIRPDVIESFKHQTVQFVPITKVGTLAYDHNEMLKLAKKRLAGKLSYTNIAQFLLPRHFTLTELQIVYETILNQTFDKRNFRKKILSLDIVNETGQKQEGVKNRPAALYEFKSTKLTELELVV